MLCPLAYNVSDKFYSISPPIAILAFEQTPPLGRLPLIPNLSNAPLHLFGESYTSGHLLM